MDHKKLTTHLRNLTETERLFFCRLLSIDPAEFDEKIQILLPEHEGAQPCHQGFKNYLIKIFSGAHIVIYDNGQFCEYLQANTGFRARPSSHETNTEKSYAFFDKNVKECLFSTRNLTENERKEHPGVTQASWVQLERHSLSASSNWKILYTLMMHLIDYIRYKFTKRNIGPYGTSEHTDKNPLVHEISPLNTQSHSN